MCQEKRKKCPGVSVSNLFFSITYSIFFGHPKWSKAFLQSTGILFNSTVHRKCVSEGVLLISLVCLYLVLLEIFEIIKKHLCHRQCLLSFNNSLLFFFLLMGHVVLEHVFEKQDRQHGGRE